MNAHMSDPARRVLSIVGPVGNSALQAVGIGEVLKEEGTNALVLCSLGDGMTQEGEVIEAIGHAVRERLPVLFFIEDNSFAISTTTGGNTFFSRPDGDPDQFYGVPITRVDGRRVRSAYTQLGTVVGEIRANGGPKIVVFEVDRLDNHTNADDQRTYRSPQEIARVARESDPVTVLREELLELGRSEEELRAMEEEIHATLVTLAREAQDSAEPLAVHEALAPLPTGLQDDNREYRGEDGDIVMLEALREVLRDHLERDPRVTLFGEDIEDPKGDVFGLTRGLSDRYGRRVRNSPLSESLIVGVSIGRALAGDRPVAFLQFADFCRSLTTRSSPNWVVCTGVRWGGGRYRLS